ncbi:hypothetical protein [Kribbella sp. VKM Ac-2568]|nr:hypothetical protein [Kribbella sp. VKM Ac-2568]TCM48962.1 hypothetical protein EV648_103230 [Kribbella sp. VKM Ac-2568]
MSEADAHSQQPTFEACERARIVDISEGTQQIQQLSVARRRLGKTSAEPS